MGAEACHGLGLAGDAGPRLFVQTLGLDQLEGDVTVELRVAGEVDAFESTLTERLLDLVLAVGEGGGHVGQTAAGPVRVDPRSASIAPHYRAPAPQQPESLEHRRCLGREPGHPVPGPARPPSPAARGPPQPRRGEPVDLSLDALAGHGTAPSWSLSDARQASTGVRTGQLAVPPMSGLSTGIDGNWGAR